MSDSTQTLVLEDGRTLCYDTCGAPAGEEEWTVFYFHGTPGSHHEGESLDEAAHKHAMRVISITRPGFGGSTAQPDRTLLMFASDVLALADHLGIQRFVVMGESGGVPYALACVHAIPATRLLAAVLVAGMYPIDPGTRGLMSFSNRVLLSLVPWAPGLVAALLDWMMSGKLARDEAHPEKFEQAMKGVLKNMPEDVKATLMANDGKLKNILVKSTREGLRQGSRPLVEEFKLFANPWGFDIAGLKVAKGRLMQWHGDKDTNIPVRIAEHAAGMIENAELRVEKDETHLSLSIRKKDQILGLLAERLRET